MCTETVKQSKKVISPVDKQIHKQNSKHVISDTQTNINDSTGNWIEIPDQKLSMEILNSIYTGTGPACLVGQIKSFIISDIVTSRIWLAGYGCP